MKTNEMYEAPALNVVIVEVNNGFAGSVGGEGDDMVIQ